MELGVVLRSRPGLLNLIDGLSCGSFFVNGSVDTTDANFEVSKMLKVYVSFAV